MPNLKEIKVKIESVKKTKKITTAMKLVAAAKVRKVQKQVLEGRPYSDKLKDILGGLQAAIKEEVDINKYPLLKVKEDVKKVLLIAISSDRGLCGAYNANILKAVRKRIKELESEGKEVQLITVGNKATGAFNKADNSQLIDSFCNLHSIPTVEEANIIANQAAELYSKGEVDKVEVISTKFISMVRADVENHTFLPVSLNHELAGDEHIETEKANSSVIFEPDVDSILSDMLPMYIENRIYQALLEATASELAARMTAMSNATSNAESFINRLVITFNKARQAAITQELSEIVGGAAALG